VSRIPHKLKGFTIIHHGYQQDVVQARDKMHRNITLLERVVQSEGSPYYRYKLGSMLLSAGRISEAVYQIELVLAALESMDDKERRQTSVGRVDVLLLLAETYERQGRHADASSAIDRALTILPASKEARYQKAVQLLGEGRIDEARAMFLAVASGHATDRSDTGGEQLTFDVSLDTWRPYTMAAKCSVRLGDLPGAIEALAAAGEFVPRSDEYLQTVRDVLDRVGVIATEKGEEDMGRIGRLKEILTEEAARKLSEGDRLYAAGDIPGALEAYASSARLSGTGGSTLLGKIARTQLRLGDTSGAFATYLRALRSLIPGDAEGLSLLIELTESFKVLTGGTPVTGDIIAVGSR